jgi:hypothetical protein
LKMVIFHWFHWERKWSNFAFHLLRSSHIPSGNLT